MNEASRLGESNIKQTVRAALRKIEKLRNPDKITVLTTMLQDLANRVQA
jgi:hypothetical protein